MVHKFACLIALGCLVLAGCSKTPQDELRIALQQQSGTVSLPPGITEIDTPLEVPAGAQNLEIVGSTGSVLRASSRFHGRALIYINHSMNIRLRNFIMEGNRQQLQLPSDMPPSATPFADYFQNNGILLDNVNDVEISNIEFREIISYAVLAKTCKRIKIASVKVFDSGSVNRRGRNNTSGGILLEEATDQFQVIDSTFTRILGNGVWTHSTSRRNFGGFIANNTFEFIGRDAIQVGHANKVRVENNTGKQIGFPINVVDIEGGGIPVGVDTSGKVDQSIYTKNRFEEINGKCFDLDGFHDGEVSENTCINRLGPDQYPQGHFALVMNNANQEMESQLIIVRDNVFDGTKFGGIFVIGTGHKIIGNKLSNINKAHCNEQKERYGCSHFSNEPDLMQSGIYLGIRAERPSPSNGVLVENNTISGYKMATRCVGTADSTQVVGNIIRNNHCSDSQ